MISNTARKFCFSMLYITTIILVLSNKPILIIHYSIDANKFKVGNRFDSNTHFITGVIKVQQCKEDELTVKEQKSLEPWLLDSESDCDHLAVPVCDFESAMRDCDDKKRKSQHLSSKSAYDPAIKKCVMGSAAEAERVWSMAGHLLTDLCSSMSPLIFEILMYLKYNYCLWDISDVVEANKRRKNSSGAANKRCAVQNERLKKMKSEVNDWDKEMNALNVAQEEDGDKEEED